MRPRHVLFRATGVYLVAWVVPIEVIESGWVWDRTVSRGREATWIALSPLGPEGKELDAGWARKSLTAG